LFFLGGAKLFSVQGAFLLAVYKVSGIVIVNPEGVSVGVAEVTYDPSGSGHVLISFKTGGQPGPWTLMWPGHEPVLITG